MRRSRALVIATYSARISSSIFADRTSSEVTRRRSVSHFTSPDGSGSFAATPKAGSNITPLDESLTLKPFAADVTKHTGNSSPFEWWIERMFTASAALSAASTLSPFSIIRERYPINCTSVAAPPEAAFPAIERSSRTERRTAARETSPDASAVSRSSVFAICRMNASGERSEA